MPGSAIEGYVFLRVKEYKINSHHVIFELLQQHALEDTVEMELTTSTLKDAINCKHQPPDGGGPPCNSDLTPSQDFSKYAACEKDLSSLEEIACQVEDVASFKLKARDQLQHDSEMTDDITIQVTDSAEQNDGSSVQNIKTSNCLLDPKNFQENAMSQINKIEAIAIVESRIHDKSVINEKIEQIEGSPEMDSNFENKLTAEVSLDKKIDFPQTLSETNEFDTLPILLGKKSDSLSFSKVCDDDSQQSTEETEKEQNTDQYEVKDLTEKSLDEAQVLINCDSSQALSCENSLDQYLAKDSLHSPAMSTLKSTPNSSNKELTNSSDILTPVCAYSNNHTRATHPVHNENSDKDESVCVNEMDNNLLTCNEENPLPLTRQHTEESLSSYKQHLCDQMDLDIETDDEETGIAFANPSIYQSYEESPVASHLHSEEGTESLLGCPVIAEYITCSEEPSICSPALVSSASGTNIEVSSSTASNNTSTLIQSTHSEAPVSSEQNYTSSAPQAAGSFSIASSYKAEQGNEHEGALCTGDQTFKTTAARHSALEPFLRPSQSNVHKSVVVQGMPQQTALSSTVQYARHLGGGTTIVQHQSLSSGMAGNVAAQATAMQQQGGATSVLQQRTMTNGGQTVLVQQRIMTTVGRQTLLQQRLAAQAAMYHGGGAIRHAPVQHVIGLQQRRVIDPAMYQAQTVSGTGIIAGGSHPLIGQRLVQGAAPQGSMMQHLVRQRYLGGPLMPGRVQMVAGRPVRIKMTYPREAVPNN